MIFKLIRMLFPNSMMSFFWWLIAFGFIAYTFIWQDFRGAVIVGDILSVGVYLSFWTFHDKE